MAKKRLQKSKIKKPGFFADERIRLVLAFIFALFAVYLALAFISFLFTGHFDQSKLDIAWLQLIKDANIEVENWTGKTGAFLANLFINKWFGIASFTFIIMLALISLKLFYIKINTFLKKIFFFLLFTIWLSVSLAFTFQNFQPESHLFIGGAHGFFISKWLTALLGKVGTAFLLLLVFIGIVIFGIQSALPWFKKLFSKKKSSENKTDDLLFPAENELIIEERESSSQKEYKAEKENTSELSDTDVEFTVEAKATEKTANVLHQQPEGDYDPTLDLSNYRFPHLKLLKEYDDSRKKVSQEELESNKNRIVETLQNYNIDIVQIKATIGPTITLYEIVPAPGIRISKIKNLEDDIALSLSALGIRIIAPIPGKGTIGIEVPNRRPEIVAMKSIIASEKFQQMDAALPVAIGKTISNETFTFDLAKMPHLLVAGATGQGKSVGLNVIIASLLYKKHPAQLKFVMIDPKKVELSIYSTIEKHFLAKLPDEEEAIITDTHKVVATLNSLCMEMDTRYDLLKKAHARNIKEYNKKFIKRSLNPENGHKYLPYIVVIIDEFADLIMTAGKEIETPIARIAQLARAVGIHMIIATQRPSTNIITGIIKANFPARIAFKVASMIDSRTIIDTPGANQLIGRGDMLLSAGSDLIRLQCAFIDTPEVDAITEFIMKQQAYPQAFMLPEYTDDSAKIGNGEVDLDNKDPFFEEAARLVVGTQQGSTSSIQRRFSIGYNRAGRIIDQLEAAGIVGPFEGSKARQVLISDDYSLEQLLRSL